MILKIGFTSDSMASVPLEEDNLDTNTKSGTIQISSDIREITSDRTASVPFEDDMLVPFEDDFGDDMLYSSTTPGIYVSQSLFFSVCKIG